MKIDSCVYRNVFKYPIYQKTFSNSKVTSKVLRAVCIRSLLLITVCVLGKGEFKKSER